MNAYTYKDNSEGVAKSKVIFVVTANSLSEADKLLQDALGINPIKCPYIGCSIQSVPKEIP